MNRIPICRADDIPHGGMRCFDTVAGLKVLVARGDDGFHACQGLCPHQEVPLDEGFFDGQTLTCHQHLWQWDIRTGEAQGLAEAPLQRFVVEEADGLLFVRRPGAPDTASPGSPDEPPHPRGEDR